MVETILPDVYIDVRAEGLIVPGRITVGRLGVVGTASKGEPEKAVLLGSYADARARFGDYDAWPDTGEGTLTLVRALELAYLNGAESVVAVRVTGKDSSGNSLAKTAEYKLQSAGGNCVTLKAASPGSWARHLTVKVNAATEAPFIAGEVPQGTAPNMTLKHKPVLNNPRNRFTRFNSQTGVTSTLEVVVGGSGPPGAGKVRLELATGKLTYGDAIQAGDQLRAWYVVDPSAAVKVTIRDGRARLEETYTAVSGATLAKAINDAPSQLVTAEPDTANQDQLPIKVPTPASFPELADADGAGNANYRDGLDKLLDQDVHIIVAAGQDASKAGSDLSAHSDNASTDLIKRDRIAVVGAKNGAKLDDVLAHGLDNASGRVVLVAPGIRTKDAFRDPPEVTLPASYAAAAVAGLLAGLPPQVSPTNKPLKVDGLETSYNSAQLAQLVQARVLALEDRRGPRVVKGITVATNTAWAQITTRRIVDFAKFGVRSAASPYIGLLNNERVRGALRATVNSFLTEMVLSEQLVSYTLDVTASRAEEIRGIARVTMTLRPVFSIDYVMVTIFLE